MRLETFSAEGPWLDAALGCFISAAGRARFEGRPAVEFCLAGGTTPAPLYRILAEDPRVADAFRGLEVGLWLGDEREVPQGHGERNGRLVSEAFEAAAWGHKLHLWPEGPASDAAKSYGDELSACLGRDGRFDLALLGLGEDGHTASLFPGDPILDMEDALAWPSLAASEPRRRMSLTFPVLRASGAIRFLARGQGKRGVVEDLAKGEARYPASRLDGEATVILYCQT